MENIPTSRQRALSHKEYLDTLLRPSPSESRRISEIQVEKEQAISAKYHTAEEHDAAKLIQRAYRGHRDRRQLNGFTLDPSSRWVEIMKEWRYRSAIAPHYSSISPESHHTAKNPSDRAKMNWQRAGQIAEHASAGLSAPTPDLASDSFGSGRSKKSKSDPPDSMLLDLRYFLEMVDQKHRYGGNLQVYHEEWQRSKSKQNFFYWLDHGGGRHEDLSMCPRDKLEKERIRYLSKEERKDYLVRVDDEGKLRWAKNNELITTSVDRYQDSMHGIVPKGSADPIFNDEEIKRQLSADAGFSSKMAAVGGLFRDTLLAENESDYKDDSSSSSSSSPPTSPMNKKNIAHHKVTNDKIPRKRFHVSPATILNHLLRASVRPGTWIYVADTVGRLYVGIKSSGAFQHASFLSGARISSAGIIGIENGTLVYLSPLSGHYRPTTKSFRAFIDTLKDEVVDMSHLKVSKAYAVLLGMEYYGKSMKDLRKAMHPDREEKKRKKSSAAKVRVTEQRDEHGFCFPIVETPAVLSATERVEQNWEKEHKRGLGRLMDDLNIRRRSEDGKW